MAKVFSTKITSQGKLGGSFLREVYQSYGFLGF